MIWNHHISSPSEVIKYSDSDSMEKQIVSSQISASEEILASQMPLLTDDNIRDGGDTGAASSENSVETLWETDNNGTSDEMRSAATGQDSAGEEAVRFKRLKLSHRSYRSHDELVAAVDSPVVVADEDVEMTQSTSAASEVEVSEPEGAVAPVVVVCINQKYRSLWGAVLLFGRSRPKNVSMYFK